MFGYLLAGENTEEWWHWGQWDWGYSPATTSGFRRWLRAKYVTDEALCSAWSDADVTLDTAQVPTSGDRRWNDDTFRPVPAHMHVIDFYVFWNEVIPDTIDLFAKTVHEETGGNKLVGAFYAFMYQNPEAEHGHNALERFLRSEHLNFAMATSGFGDRFLGGVDYGRQTPRSVQLHGKVFYFDMDYSSHLNTERERARLLADPALTEAERLALRDWQPTDQGDRESRGRNTWEDLQLYRRVVGFSLCNGMNQSVFDIAHGSFDTPDHMAEISRLNQLLARAAAVDRSSIAEILVVADEVSCAYLTSAAAWSTSDVLRSVLRDTQFSLPKLGAPHDQVLLNDLDRIDLGRYRLVVFLNAFQCDERQRALIETVKADGRTVVWTYAPGLFKGNRRSPDFMHELTEIRLAVPEDNPPGRLLIDLEENAHPLAEALGRYPRRQTGSQRMARPVVVDDPQCVVLGRGVDTGSPALAVKALADWTSVYALTSDLAPEVYRELARFAGVHLYSERNDAFYANASYMTLHADGAGPRRLMFRAPLNLADALTGQSLASGVADYERDLKHGETLILRWDQTHV